MKELTGWRVVPGKGFSRPGMKPFITQRQENFLNIGMERRPNDASRPCTGTSRFRAGERLCGRRSVSLLMEPVLQNQQPP
jgi:hypothetical protein